MDRSRLFAAIELFFILVLWVVTVWLAWRLTGATLWTGAGICGLTLTVFASALVRRPGWKNSGFRLDNFWHALLRLSLLVFLLLLPLVVAAGAVEFRFPSPSRGQTTGLFALGVFQQAFFLGYLFHRWNLLVGNRAAAVFLNAFSFALVHLPHMPLVFLTALAGLLFGAVFVKIPNVFAIGLAHGALSLVGSPLLYSMGVLDTKQIGPSELAPLAAMVTRELKPGDRIGIGPRDIGQVQLGRSFASPIEPIGASYADDRINREQLELFLRSERRVFCFITERDFRRYAGPESRQRIFRLGERYILKRKLTFDGEFLQAFFGRSGDIPVIGPFRERVLLISNQASP